MKKMILYIFLLTPLTLFYSSSSTACNGLAVTPQTPTYSFNSGATGNLVLEVSRVNKVAGCDWFVGLGTGGSGNFNQRLLVNGSFDADYNIHVSANVNSTVLKDIPTAINSDEVLSGSFNAGGGPSSRNVRYRPILTDEDDIDNIQRFGTFTDSVQVNLYESVFPPSGSISPVDTTTISFTYTVAKRALLTLVDTGAGFQNPPRTSRSIDFGTLSTGQNSTFDMVLLYNAGFDITLESVNGQRLKHITENSFVPYTITIGGVSATLPAATPTSVITATGVSPSAPTGDARAISVTIGNTTGAIAGNYSDSITITISSIE